ncbi:hypothetical protein LJC27_05995 [Christensenellaceae bacterium OttesenSCG-928-M15]|nr:hypothetical protein [Christensenellaceae bacterium OttesenSCG-928-M15]
MNTEFLMQIAAQYPHPGNERDAAIVISKHFDPLAQRIDDPALTYPAYCLKGAAEKGPVTAIVTQLDEPGFLVREHLEKGFVGFEAYGEIDKRALTAQEVYLFGKEKYFGVIGNKPSHYLTEEDKKASVEISKLFIDTGIKPEELKECIPVGSFIGLKAEPRLMRAAIAGHGLSFKAGLLAMLTCVKELSSAALWGQCYFLIADRSARGRGELVRALKRYGIERVIALMSVPANRREGDAERTVPGLGPALMYTGSVDYALTNSVRESAEEGKIPVQSFFCNFDEEGLLELVYSAGYPCAGIAAPIENGGMPFALAHLSDIERAGRLAAHCVKGGGCL